MKQHQVTHYSSRMTARQRVVTDKGDALWGKVLANRLQKAVAHGFWNPCVDAVGNDVIELTEFTVESGEVSHFELNVFEPDIPNCISTALNGLLCDINSDER